MSQALAHLDGLHAGGKEQRSPYLPQPNDVADCDWVSIGVDDHIGDMLPGWGYVNRPASS